MKTCAIISFRLGGTDGVAVVAESWRQALQNLGWHTYTVAGPQLATTTEQTPVDCFVDGLEIGATEAPDPSDVSTALAKADLVLCENILSIPLNLPASRVVADVLAGRPAILHHHDLPWQRQRHQNCTELPPPSDRHWRHVVINQLTRQQLAQRDIAAAVIYNGFDTTVTRSDPVTARRQLGFDDDELVFVHPVRAIDRKNIPAAVELAEQLQATYWLTGQTEENYHHQLAKIFTSAHCKIVRTPAPSIAEMYAACDLVVFPSIWEGFGNPPVEAAIYRRLAAVGNYPVAAELRALGFRWLDPANTDEIAAALAGDQNLTLNHNQKTVEQHFSAEILSLIHI